MRESPADTRRAVGLSLLLHAVLLGLMFAGFMWERSSKPASAAGSPISAELIDASDLSPAMQRTLADRPDPVPVPVPPAPPVPEPLEEEEVAPLPQPLPEPIAEDSPVPPQQVAQEQVPEPEPVEQEEVRRDAISAETREREQEEKRRQEQIDLTERERQAEAERRQRLAQQQEEREKQLAEIRRRRAAAAREAELLEEKQKQLANRRAQQASEAARNAAAAAPAAAEPPGNNGVDAGLSARYAAALQEAILRNWTRPDNVPLGQRCQIRIRQLPGGEVMDVTVSPSCPYDELGRRSVEAAVLKAQPLPYAGFEQVFQRNLTLNFEASDR